MKKRDIIFILSVILICMALFIARDFPKEEGDTVTIYVNSQLYKQISLSENQTIDINGTNTLVIENGAARMESADCPDKLCVKQGKIYDSSKSIVCLPNGVSVQISKKSETDAVAR